MLSLLSAEIVAQRVFSPLYIVLDTVFLVFLVASLIYRKRYATTLFALFGGILYMIVDYGIFHLALGTRSIENGDLFLVLLWMSMSYGMTNFALIWIWLNKDEHYIEYTALIWIWWICCPLLTSTFAKEDALIKIQRTTGAYHGYMALIMIVSYFAAIIYNLTQKDKNKKFNIPWLFLLGVLAQLGWEAGLLIGGIRSAEFDPFTKIMTLITNSLVETNLGLPAIYCIYLLYTSKFTEDLKKREANVGFYNRIAENNAAKYHRKNKLRENAA